MYLLALVVSAGALLLLGRSWITGKPLHIVQFRLFGLVPIAVLPQLFAFYIPATRVWVPSVLAPVILVWSQLVLLGFILVNWKRPGMLLLGIGLTMNFVVILANGGAMPVAPEMVQQMTGHHVHDVGTRLGPTKGVVLSSESTTFASLSDRFLVPEWMPYRAAFSLGDVFIVAGALVFLWAMGRGGRDSSQPKQQPMMVIQTQAPSEYGPPNIGGL